MTIVEPPPLALRPIGALLHLVDCVCDELATSGGGPTCWCGVHPGGAISWEYCGECDGGRCGMGWVRLASVFPYDVFPNVVVDERCASPLAMSVEVGALRCVPQPPDGSIASPDVMTEVSLVQAADAFALHRAVQCCDLAMGGGKRTALTTYTPVGPSGGCVGGFWTIFVDVG